MGSTHNHAPWRKSILVPFWCIQVLLQIVMIGLFALAVSVLVTWENTNNGVTTDYYTDGTVVDKNAIDKSLHIVVPIWMTILVISFILTLTEIILLAKHKLKPSTFVITHTIKTTIWTAIFIMDIISIVDRSTSRTASAFGIVIEAGLLLVYVIPLIYGGIIYHRYRRDKTSYKPVEHPEQFPMASTEYTGGYGHQTYISAVPNPYNAAPTFPTPYGHAQPQPYGQPISVPAPYQAFATAEGTRDVEAQAERAQGERRPSYNHQRDTRFDSFRQDRTSIGNYGDVGLGNVSPPLPEIHVADHDAGVGAGKVIR